MKRIAPAPSEIPHKINKLTNTVGDTTLKYIMKCLEAWIKEIKKISQQWKFKRI